MLTLLGNVEEASQPGGHKLLLFNTDKQLIVLKLELSQARYPLWIWLINIATMFASLTRNVLCLAAAALTEQPQVQTETKAQSGFNLNQPHFSWQRATIPSLRGSMSLQKGTSCQLYLLYRDDFFPAMAHFCGDSVRLTHWEQIEESLPCQMLLLRHSLILSHVAYWFQFVSFFFFFCGVFISPPSSSSSFVV